MSEIYTTIKDENGDFDVCNQVNEVSVVCEFCDKKIEAGKAQSTGGNYKTGLMHTWICQPCDNESEANYAGGF